MMYYEARFTHAQSDYLPVPRIVANPRISCLAPNRNHPLPIKSIPVNLVQPYCVTLDYIKWAQY